MLTIFSTTKPSKGHIAVIQRNAIRSWTLLQPRPEIILIGDEPGAHELCQEFGLRHLPEVERNEFGTPLVRSLFALGQAHATFETVCYVNADIIFLKDFIDAVDAARQGTHGGPFLLLGGRWNVERIDPELLDRPDRDAALKTYATAHGFHDDQAAMDYFVFPKSFTWQLPDFAIGRNAWDSWFPYQARRKGIAVIDGSPVITAIHQNHDYAHFLRGEISTLHTAEGKQNLRLIGFGRRYLISSANLKITPSGLQPTRNQIRMLRDRLQEVELHVVYRLRRWWPYSAPLYMCLKVVKRAVKWFAHGAQALVSMRQSWRSGSVRSE